MAEKVTKGSHTPGPWSVEDPIDSDLCIVEANKPVHEWKFIATIYLRQGNDPDEFSHAVSEANARLIAAAPELLEALEDLFAASGQPSKYKLLEDARFKALAAIRKVQS